MTKDNISS